MAQPETGGGRTTEGEGGKLETPSDDEEITIPSQDRADIRNVDIHGEQSENTQREDWLLPTEPRHGARPRDWCGAPSGNGRFRIQDPPSVTRKAD